MKLPVHAWTTLDNGLRKFVESHDWSLAGCESITGDASVRSYFRLKKGKQTAILMDASRNRESLVPFVKIARHLAQLGFSVPAVLAEDDASGFLLLEDFGDQSFARLLVDPRNSERLYSLATDVLVALHNQAQAIPVGLNAYDPGRMLNDLDLFLEWRTPALSSDGKSEFRALWRDLLPLAQQVPTSILLRDYHVANLMFLPERKGIQRAGLLDFQDAYLGPITYDLVSLLEDARRDVPETLRRKMLARYLARVPAVDPSSFETSLAILAAQRHLRVLAIFRRLSRQAGRHEYEALHSPRVEFLLEKAMRHPSLARMKHWLDHYARQD